ncbi:MAG: tRNA 5-methylaminomethyl-2-thiouridine synthase, partial [Campylobacter sp.]
LIMDLVLARPLCIERSLFHELHPARFLIRKLKKGLKF